MALPILLTYISNPLSNYRAVIAMTYVTAVSAWLIVMRLTSWSHHSALIPIPYQAVIADCVLVSKGSLTCSTLRLTHSWTLDMAMLCGLG